MDRRDEELTIIDIALLPEWRGQGIGGRLLRDILEQSRQTEKPVRIHVEQNNPAKRLYERLGFQKIAGQGVYDHLEWRPHPDV